MTLIYKSRSSGGQVADRATDFALVDVNQDNTYMLFTTTPGQHLGVVMNLNLILKIADMERDRP